MAQWIDIRLDEARVCFLRRRPILIRIPLGFGFCAGYTGAWGLWSKQGTFSRSIAQWLGLEVID